MTTFVQIVMALSEWGILGVVAIAALMYAGGSLFKDRFGRAAAFAAIGAACMAFDSVAWGHRKRNASEEYQLGRHMIEQARQSALIDEAEAEADARVQAMFQDVGFDPEGDD